MCYMLTLHEYSPPIGTYRRRHPLQDPYFTYSTRMICTSLPRSMISSYSQLKMSNVSILSVFNTLPSTCVLKAVLYLGDHNPGCLPAVCALLFKTQQLASLPLHVHSDGLALTNQEDYKLRAFSRLSFSTSLHVILRPQIHSGPMRSSMVAVSDYKWRLSVFTRVCLHHKMYSGSSTKRTAPYDDLLASARMSICEIQTARLESHSYGTVRILYSG